MRYFKPPFKLLFPVLLAFLLNATPGKAQNVLAFTPNGFSGWPQNDTAFAGDSIPVGGYLKNYSPSTTFSDSLRIDGYVDTGAFPIPFSYSFYSLYPVFNIAPGDSQFLIIPFRFSTDTGNVGAPQFHVGNNVVVVWPIGVGPGSFNPGDSVVLNVFLIDTTSGTGPGWPPSNIRIYPVPANGPLYITSFHPQFQMTSVVIRNMAGQIVYAGNGGLEPINTEAWAPGLYSVETTLSNGERGFYKVMRQ